MALQRREQQGDSPINVHDVHTILGPESSFEGKLIFDGTVRVDGKLKGEVRTGGALVVGQSAHVEAELHVGSVVVHGTVTGNIEAQNAIDVHATARILGNLSCPELTVAKGAIICGQINMADGARAENEKIRADAAPGDAAHNN